jgi:predicted transcriptional regulator
MSSPDKVDSVVFEIVKEYLNKKPFFSLEDIITFINNRSRGFPYLNRNMIEKIIKNLIKKRILVPGTKLMKNNIIEHPIRNEIYNYIKNNPSNINEIMKAINIGSNQALWHLSCLEKFQFTRSRKIDNQRIVFEYDSNPELDELYYYLNQDIVQDIIELMKRENKKIKLTKIAKELKKNYSTVKKYLKILINLKIIKAEKDNKRVLFKLDLDKYQNVTKSISNTVD